MNQSRVTIDRRAVRHALVDLGTHQYVIAAKVGMAPTRLGQLIRGEKLASPEVLDRLAAALGVEPEKLIAK